MPPRVRPLPPRLVPGRRAHYLRCPGRRTCPHSRALPVRRAAWPRQAAMPVRQAAMPVRRAAWPRQAAWPDAHVAAARSRTQPATRQSTHRSGPDRSGPDRSGPDRSGPDRGPRHPALGYLNLDRSGPARPGRMYPIRSPRESPGHLASLAVCCPARPAGPRACRWWSDSVPDHGATDAMAVAAASAAGRSGGPARAAGPSGEPARAAGRSGERCADDGAGPVRLGNLDPAGRIRRSLASARPRRGVRHRALHAGHQADPAAPAGRRACHAQTHPAVPRKPRARSCRTRIPPPPRPYRTGSWSGRNACPVLGRTGR